MVIISLLKLPLDLPQDAPARAAGLTSFTDRLPEWISSCEFCSGLYFHCSPCKPPYTHKRTALTISHRPNL